MKYFKFLVPFFLLSFHLIAQEPTIWRGSQSSGIYKAEKLLQQWHADGPKILWTFDQLGKGFSSPAFANNKIYINGMIEGEAVLFILDMNGKLLEQFKYGKEFDQSYSGTRSTPTILGNLAYLYTGMGSITCLDTSNGKALWTKDVFIQADGINIRWGVTESLIVDGNVVYCTPGGKTNNVMALNRMTGEPIWNCAGLGELSAYCTPLLIKLASRNLLVTHTASHVIGIDASSGELLWNFEHPNQWSVHPNTPIYSDGYLFVFSGYGQGGAMLKLAANGSGVTKEWEIKSFDSRMGGAVLLNGFLYGSGDKDRSWQCIDWNTGEKKYTSTQFGKGVTIAVNNCLIGYSEKGELFMAKANPSGLQVIGSTKVAIGSDQHWAHPVVFDNKLYLRHGNVLIAYQISE